MAELPGAGRIEQGRKRIGVRVMKSMPSQLQRADTTIWTTIGLIAVIVLASSVVGSFRIDWASFQAAAIAGSLLCAAGWFYTKIRKDLRAAAALFCTAQLAAFAAVGAPLSYIAASLALPLWDQSFAAWDSRLGLDWMALLATMNSFPSVHWIFAGAYLSFPPQSITIVLALAATGRILRLRVYLFSFILAALVTIAISAVMPAQGVWGHLGLMSENYAIRPVTRELHLAIFHGLRDGTFRGLVAQGAEGIITFPSLHTAIGVLFIVAMWPVRYLRWVAVLLNVTMIVATPVDGGHYFTDVIAGAIVAALSWIAASRAFGEVPERTPKHLATIEDPPSIVPEALSESASTPVSRKLESV
jgi:membrane-associated phospholipid phosphatase